MGGKCAGALKPFCIRNAQEGTEAVRQRQNTLGDLYKKFRPGGPTDSRSHAPFLRRRYPVFGLIRFEMWNPMRFAGVKESTMSVSIEGR